MLGLSGIHLENEKANDLWILTIVKTLTHAQTLNIGNWNALCNLRDFFKQLLTKIPTTMYIEFYKKNILLLLSSLLRPEEVWNTWDRDTDIRGTGIARIERTMVWLVIKKILELVNDPTDPVLQTLIVFRAKLVVQHYDNANDRYALAVLTINSYVARRIHILHDLITNNPSEPFTLLASDQINSLKEREQDKLSDNDVAQIKTSICKSFDLLISASDSPEKLILLRSALPLALADIAAVLNAFKLDLGTIILDNSKYTTFLSEIVQSSTSTDDSTTKRTAKITKLPLESGSGPATSPDNDRILDSRMHSL